MSGLAASMYAIVIDILTGTATAMTEGAGAAPTRLWMPRVTKGFFDALESPQREFPRDYNRRYDAR